MSADQAPRYWKVLNAQGQSCHGGSFQWSLPRWDARKGWIPGDWTPAIKNPVPCESGYHVCRDGDLVHWLHERIYLCEVRGETKAEHDKVVAESVRLLMPTPWDEVSARLFAVECAAEVLSLYEEKYPNDPRVSDALEVATRFALGDASESERSAAGSAAWSAGSAAWSAAGSAAWSAGSAAWSAAGSAARSAAGSAGSAAGSAARSAAGSAQTARLLWWMGVTV